MATRDKRIQWEGVQVIQQRDGKFRWVATGNAVVSPIDVDFFEIRSDGAFATEEEAQADGDRYIAEQRGKG